MCYVCGKHYECSFSIEVFKEYRKKPFVSALWNENHSQSLSLNNCLKAYTSVGMGFVL